MGLTHLPREVEGKYQMAHLGDRLRGASSIQLSCLETHVATTGIPKLVPWPLDLVVENRVSIFREASQIAPDMEMLRKTLKPKVDFRWRITLTDG